MTRRWLIRVLVLVVLAAFIVWLEPTRVVWGWLRGESFYDGRPTSYWRGELARWKYGSGFGFAGGGLFVYEPSWVERTFPKAFPGKPPSTFYPPPLNVPYDPALETVLTQLKDDPSPRVRRNARVGLWLQDIRREPDKPERQFTIPHPDLSPDESLPFDEAAFRKSFERWP